jgi:DNA-binding FadR family transcriptional regulator
VRTRTGTRVLPSVSWNHLDPDILRWRFASALDAKFVSDVIELRRVVEPAAAELQRRAPPSVPVHAIEVALHDMATATDINAHHAADLRFHFVHSGSRGNDLLLGLRHGIEGALNFAIRLLTRSKEEAESSHALQRRSRTAITRKTPRRLARNGSTGRSVGSRQPAHDSRNKKGASNRETRRQPE